MTVACAQGKIILCGEHAVVYGRPAIAVPVAEVQARATVEDGVEGQGIVIVARDLGRVVTLGDEASDETRDPLLAAAVNTLEYLGLGLGHDLVIVLESTIPVARGLGSGAAVSAAITRALAQHFSKDLTAEQVSGLVYDVEKLYHGTPSGVDNTVVAHQRAVYFVRGQRLEILRVGAPLLLLIADTGVESPTRAVVGAVRSAWQESKDRYETLFDEVGGTVVGIRDAMEKGDAAEVGRLMDENHRLLRAMEVSSSQLDALVNAAKRHGALGAKLSGAGRGGNMIALATPESCQKVKEALQDAGAQGVLQTEVKATTDVTGPLAPSMASPSQR